MSDIYYTRGDTAAIHRNIRFDGILVNVTGWSFVLTVNAEAAPGDTDEQQFQVAATLTDAPNGSIDFYPTAEQTDIVGTFYFDIEAVNSDGERSTIETGLFVVRMDLAKAEDTFVWTPSDEPDDGDPAPGDGSTAVICRELDAVVEQFYETIDGRRVVQWPLPAGGYTVYQVYGDFRGPDLPHAQFFGPGQEFKVTAHIDNADCYFSIQGGAVWLVVSPWLDTSKDPKEAGYNTNLWDGTRIVAVAADTPPDPTGWPNIGWYVLGMRINPDWTVETMVQPYGGAENWYAFDPQYTWYYGHHVSQLPTFGLYSDPGGSVSLWKFEWRRLLS